MSMAPGMISIPAKLENRFAGRAASKTQINYPPRFYFYYHISSEGQAKFRYKETSRLKLPPWNPLPINSLPHCNTSTASCSSLSSVVKEIMPADVMPEKTYPTIPPLSKDTSNANSKSQRLEGKIAIVTGGAKGIGEATVRLFARHGAKVVIADVEDVLGSALAGLLSPSVTYVHCDVSLEEDVENLIDSTVSRYGRLDVMFNNAGVLGSQSKHKSIVDFDADEFDRVMRVNVRGSALGMKHAARVMIPRGTGCIISTASVAGVMGGLGPHSYTASKHAIVGLTKNTACELGKYGIRVNCISPFGVATSMLINAWRSGDDEEEERAGEISLDLESSIREREAEKMEEFVRSLANLKNATLRTTDIAEAALYLASDESRYVSGHNLVVDGGITTSRNCVGL